MDFSGRQRQERNPYSKPWWLVPKNVENVVQTVFGAESKTFSKVAGLIFRFGQRKIDHNMDRQV